MRVYELRREQRIARPVAEVFAFFSDASNLETITPPWMQFRIVTPSPLELRAGARIEYALKWRVFSIRWLTEIEIWEPPHRFVDNQLSGPYRLWRHTHQFLADRSGTRMLDEVRYALPLGPLGRMAHAIRVRGDLEHIFDYRGRRIAELCAGRQGSPDRGDEVTGIDGL